MLDSIFARSPRLLTLGLIYCSAAWGSTFYLVKETIAFSHPLVLIAWRFLLGALLIMPLTRSRSRDFRPGALLAAVVIAIYFSQACGLLWTSASNSGFITGLFVLFVPIIGFLFYGQTLNLGQVLAVGLALTGLWMLTGAAANFNWGDALTLIGALASGWHIILIDRCVKRGCEPFALTLHQFWITGIAALAISWGLGLPLIPQDAFFYGAVIYLALVPTASVYIVQLTAQKYVSPLEASLIFALEPLFAAFFAWALGGEKLGILALAGGCLMVAAAIFGELSARQGQVPAVSRLVFAVKKYTAG